MPQTTPHVLPGIADPSALFFHGAPRQSIADLTKVAIRIDGDTIQPASAGPTSLAGTADEPSQITTVQILQIQGVLEQWRDEAAIALGGPVTGAALTLSRAAGFQRHSFEAPAITLEETLRRVIHAWPDEAWQTGRQHAPLTVCWKRGAPGNGAVVSDLWAFVDERTASLDPVASAWLDGFEHGLPSISELTVEFTIHRPTAHERARVMRQTG